MFKSNQILPQIANKFNIFFYGLMLQVIKFLASDKIMDNSELIMKGNHTYNIKCVALKQKNLYETLSPKTKLAFLSTYTILVSLQFQQNKTFVTILL